MYRDEMTRFVLISVFLLQLTWCYAYPRSQGVGVYSYQDSAGNSIFSRPRFRPFSSPFRRRFPHFAGGPFFGPENFGANMDNSPHQSAFASAVAGPGFRHQVAAIDPINTGMPNVDVTRRFGDPNGDGDSKFVSVSSSSFASSSNVDGKVTGYRGAETVVNDNGKVTKYKVHS